MKNFTLSTLSLLASFAVVPSLPAQTYTLPWQHIGPGGSGAGGVYSVSGGSGQWDAGHQSAANTTLDGGFWVWNGAQAGGPTNDLNCSNLITGTLRFTNSNPAILSLLNSPGNEGMGTWNIGASSLPGGDRKSVV